MRFLMNEGRMKNTALAAKQMNGLFVGRIISSIEKTAETLAWEKILPTAAIQTGNLDLKK